MLMRVGIPTDDKDAARDWHSAIVAWDAMPQTLLQGVLDSHPSRKNPDAILALNIDI